MYGFQSANAVSATVLKEVEPSMSEPFSSSCRYMTKPVLLGQRSPEIL